PGVLGAGQHDRDELSHFVLDRPAGLAALLLAHYRPGGSAVDQAEQRQRIDAEQPGDDQPDDDGPEADASAAAGTAGNPHAAQASEPAAAASPSILDVRALSLSAPPHGQLPAACLQRDSALIGAAPQGPSSSWAPGGAPRPCRRFPVCMPSMQRGKPRFMRLVMDLRLRQRLKGGQYRFLPSFRGPSPRAAAGAPFGPVHTKSTGPISH